jgi:hypothetical protein
MLWQSARSQITDSQTIIHTSMNNGPQLQSAVWRPTLPTINEEDNPSQSQQQQPINTQCTDWSTINQPSMKKTPQQSWTLDREAAAESWLDQHPPFSPFLLKCATRSMATLSSLESSKSARAEAVRRMAPCGLDSRQKILLFKLPYFCWKKEFEAMLSQLDNTKTTT